MKNNFINNIFSLIYKMKTTSLKKLLNHNFFIYGMVFISVLQLLNFYNAYSLLCLGTFGITYYVACNATKNKGVCLLAANIVSIFILGCEKSGVLDIPGNPNLFVTTNLFLEKMNISKIEELPLLGDYFSNIEEE